MTDLFTPGPLDHAAAALEAYLRRPPEQPGLFRLASGKTAMALPAPPLVFNIDDGRPKADLVVAVDLDKRAIIGAIVTDDIAAAALHVEGGKVYAVHRNRLAPVAFLEHDAFGCKVCGTWPASFRVHGTRYCGAHLPALVTEKAA